MILYKKLWRTIFKYKAQFISMILMIALGIGVFWGFNIEWYSIEKVSKDYFTKSNFADYKLYSTTGFSSEDIASIREISSIDEASRVLSVKVSVDNSKANLSLNAYEDYGISTFEVMSGENYDKNSLGIWLSDKFASENNLKLNDFITLEYSDKFNLQIVGLIKSSEFMVCVDENQLMPDYSVYGFAYVSPRVILDNLGIEFYNQIFIKSKLDKETLENEVNAKLNKNILVLSLEENSVYQSAMGEAEEGKTMGAIIPVLFLVIAILTMITTMSRIAKNEKTQIGTLKALGFKDRTILFHYMLFGLMVGLIGSIIGVALGYGIARIIISPTGMMSTYFDWIDWTLYMPWFCPIAIIMVILILACVSYFGVKKFLDMAPADTLRPYTPKHVKQTQLEKTKLWQKFSFGFKWNYRDTIRNKTRSLVTLIGVVGCVILVVASMGMGNSMDGFMSTLNGSMNYNSKINISTTATIPQIDELSIKYSAEQITQMSIKFNSKPITLEIYPENTQFARFYDKDNKQMTIKSDGIYICERLSKEGINVGDTVSFSLYGTDDTYNVKVAGINKSLVSETITMTKEFADNLGLNYIPTSLLTNTLSDNIQSNEIITSVQSKDNLIQSYGSFLQIMNSMIIVLIVSALGLGIIVLYNLGVMSYTERYRELATLKVVGFKDKQISQLLIGQNTILTCIGTIIGLPLGYGVLYWLVNALASEYELKVTIHFVTYLISIAMTIGVSVLVGLLISRKNKKIDMVEALKDKE